MSEKGKELALEEEKEEVILHHWSHQHPLTLVETRRGYDCYGCRRRVSSGEQGYGCRNKCKESIMWHQECAEMPRKIKHPMHPQHILFQHQITQWPSSYYCVVCGKSRTDGCFYNCLLGCRIVMGLECAQQSGVMDAADDDDERSRRIIRHPSHPHHELRLLRKCAFKCNACGSMHKGLGDSFSCTVCEYWIHHSCATLPTTIKREDHHDHPLSLSFHVPLEYIKFDYKCEVCRKHLILKYWIYHCQLCRYVVHVKCAFNKSSNTTIRNNANEKGIIQFPIDDVGEELIRAFVIREGGAITPIPCDDEIVNAKYKFHFHKHELSLISLTSYGGVGEEKEEEEEEEDSDDDECGRISQLICDGCTSPIFEKKHGSSSSSSDSDKRYYYMRCNECKYSLHLACFHLPPRLPSLPLLHDADHELVLQPRAKLLHSFWSDCMVSDCTVCGLQSNGLFYVCTRSSCRFKADIKCASLPNTIYHTAHPEHHLNYHHNQYTRLWCAAGCLRGSIYGDYYGCDDCEFDLHVKCAVLPASVRNGRWDKKHRLLLRWDASVNHPDAFCCDACEQEMNPKMQMYHCRPCDLSFHPHCLPAMSGSCRNIKFGQQYAFAAAHHHPLTYQLLTTKRRCNFCLRDKYHWRGFCCASCNFFICQLDCAEYRLKRGSIHALD